jgi:hypothetical protein
MHPAQPQNLLARSHLKSTTMTDNQTGPDYRFLFSLLLYMVKLIPLEYLEARRKM